MEGRLRQSLRSFSYNKEKLVSALDDERRELRRMLKQSEFARRPDNASAILELGAENFDIYCSVWSLVYEVGKRPVDPEILFSVLRVLHEEGYPGIDIIYFYFIRVVDRSEGHNAVAFIFKSFFIPGTDFAFLYIFHSGMKRICLTKEFLGVVSSSEATRSQLLDVLSHPSREKEDRRARILVKHFLRPVHLGPLGGYYTDLLIQIMLASNAFSRLDKGHKSLFNYYMDFLLQKADPDLAAEYAAKLFTRLFPELPSRDSQMMFIRRLLDEYNVADLVALGNREVAMTIFDHVFMQIDADVPVLYRVLSEYVPQSKPNKPKTTSFDERILRSTINELGRADRRSPFSEYFELLKRLCECAACRKVTTPILDFLNKDAVPRNVRSNVERLVRSMLRHNFDETSMYILEYLDAHAETISKPWLATIYQSLKKRSRPSQAMDTAVFKKVIAKYLQPWSAVLGDKPRGPHKLYFRTLTLVLLEHYSKSLSLSLLKEAPSRQSFECVYPLFAMVVKNYSKILNSPGNAIYDGQAYANDFSGVSESESEGAAIFSKKKKYSKAKQEKLNKSMRNSCRRAILCLPLYDSVVYEEASVQRMREIVDSLFQESEAVRECPLMQYLSLSLFPETIDSKKLSIFLGGAEIDLVARILTVLIMRNLCPEASKKSLDSGNLPSMIKRFAKACIELNSSELFESFLFTTIFLAARCDGASELIKFWLHFLTKNFRWKVDGHVMGFLEDVSLFGMLLGLEDAMIKFWMGIKDSRGSKLVSGYISRKYPNLKFITTLVDMDSMRDLYLEFRRGNPDDTSKRGFFNFDLMGSGKKTRNVLIHLNSTILGDAASLLKHVKKARTYGATGFSVKAHNTNLFLSLVCNVLYMSRGSNMPMLIDKKSFDLIGKILSLEHLDELNEWMHLIVESPEDPRVHEFISTFDFGLVSEPFSSRNPVRLTIREFYRSNLRHKIEAEVKHRVTLDSSISRGSVQLFTGLKEPIVQSRTMTNFLGSASSPNRQETDSRTSLAESETENLDSALRRYEDIIIGKILSAPGRDLVGEICEGFLEKYRNSIETLESKWFAGDRLGSKELDFLVANHPDLSAVETNYSSMANFALHSDIAYLTMK